MLTKIITKWNFRHQTQKEVDEELTKKLLGALYRVRASVASGNIGLMIPFVELGDMDEEAYNVFTAKICESVVFQGAFEALNEGGFNLFYAIETEKKRIALYITKNNSEPQKESCIS